jgi:SAM-dependent methyltransferase
MTTTLQAKQIRNPHFDDGLIVWRDEYSGRYKAPANGYSEEFDLQWKLCLNGHEDFNRAAGASVEDRSIADRIYEWTGKHPGDRAAYDSSSGSRSLDHPLDVGLIQNKECIDIGCGLGRWTRTMLALGAKSVLSVDMSESALASVRRFNENALKADITDIPSRHPELVGRFDFANLWGVAMCTHDPLKAFLSAAATVKPGGAMYLMVYAPEGIHASMVTNLRRKQFAQLPTTDARLAYVDQVYHRRWDACLSLKENLSNMLRNVLRRPKGSKIGVLDMLEPFYNWVIPINLIESWMQEAGFAEVCLLNQFEPKKCAYHVLGTNRVIRDERR